MRVGNGEKRVDKKGLDGVRDRMDEAMQGRKRRRWEGGNKRRLTTRRGIRNVEFQPEFKTIKVGSKMRRTFR